jgi:hypothetical protein
LEQVQVYSKNYALARRKTTDLTDKSGENDIKNA